MACASDSDVQDPTQHLCERTNAVRRREPIAPSGRRRVGWHIARSPLRISAAGGSVLCLALGLISSAWLGTAGPLRGSTEPRLHPERPECVTPAPASACNRLVSSEDVLHVPPSSVAAACHPGTDELLLTRHRKLRKRRSGPGFDALPWRVAPRQRLPVAVVVSQPGDPHDRPSPHADHARAPPSSNHPA